MHTSYTLALSTASRYEKSVTPSRPRNGPGGNPVGIAKGVGKGVCVFKARSLELIIWLPDRAFPMRRKAAPGASMLASNNIKKIGMV
jgi:hypothetical protein